MDVQRMDVEQYLELLAPGEDRSDEFTFVWVRGDIVFRLLPRAELRAGVGVWYAHLSVDDKEFPLDPAGAVELALRLRDRHRTRHLARVSALESASR